MRLGVEELGSDSQDGRRGRRVCTGLRVEELGGTVEDVEKSGYDSDVSLSSDSVRLGGDTRESKAGIESVVVEDTQGDWPSGVLYSARTGTRDLLYHFVLLGRPFGSSNLFACRNPVMG